MTAILASTSDRVLPPRWSFKALKYAATLVHERTDRMPLGARYVGLEHIESRTGRFAAVTDDMQVTADSTVSAFNVGDVLFGKLRPYLAKAVVADSPGYCSSEILVFRPHSLTPEYLRYVMLLDDFLEAVNSTTYGSKMPRADASAIARIPVPCPPFNEQAAITTFLDAETTRIDELIREKSALIIALSNLERAMAYDLVTGRLHPDASTKNSGLEWLPRVPAHWAVKRNMFLFEQRREPGLDGLPILQVSLHTGVTEGDDEDEGSARVRRRMEDKSSYQIVRRGDVAYNMMRAWQGAIGAVPIDGLVSPAYVVLTPTEELDPHFFEILARTDSYIKECERHSYGIASFRWRLYWEGFKEIGTPVPPIEEQRAIVAAFSKERDRIALLRAHVERELELLAELRTTTISDAVMGRIDARGFTRMLSATETIG